MNPQVKIQKHNSKVERKIYLQQLYLPHFYMQGDNVSPRLSDMNLQKPIRLQLFNRDATRILFDGNLTKEEIRYIQNL